MESKTWYVTPEAKEKEIEIRSHFGWTLLTSTEISFTMKRDDKPVNARLRSLEKQYNYLKKKFPTASLIWLLIGGLTLIPGILLWGKIVIDFLFILIASFALVVGLYLLFMFLFTLPSRKKMIQELFSTADELAGKKISLPIPGNIKKPIDRSYKIRDAVRSGELEIK